MRSGNAGGVCWSGDTVTTSGREQACHLRCALRGGDAGAARGHRGGLLRHRAVGLVGGRGLHRLRHLAALAHGPLLAPIDPRGCRRPRGGRRSTGTVRGSPAVGGGGDRRARRAGRAHRHARAPARAGRRARPGPAGRRRLGRCSSSCGSSARCSAGWRSSAGGSTGRRSGRRWSSAASALGPGAPASSRAAVDQRAVLFEGPAPYPLHRRSSSKARSARRTVSGNWSISTSSGRNMILKWAGRSSASST